VSTIGNQICLSDLTIQHLASFYGHRGGKGKLGKHQTAEHRANISMVLSGKVFTGFRVQDVKWIDNLENCKTFFVVEGRMPKLNAGE